MEKSDVKLEFVYDYAGRRVERKVYSGSSANWTLSKQLKFIYDGFKCIEELDGANSDAVLRKYLWNGDGERLLAITDTTVSATYYYFADANKNIGQLIDSSGNIKAQYEYSPFGVETFTGGTYTDNPFHFSSEYFDSETNLIYYNYRYYNPSLERWLSRDPIEEKGGWNLYCMLSNNVVNDFDSLGRASATIFVLTVVVVDTVTPDPTDVVVLPKVPVYILALVTAVLIDIVTTSPPPSDSECRRCKPCVPPVGTIAFRGPDTGRSHGGMSPHYHIYEMHQSPPSMCKCFWHELNFQATPRGVPISPAGGGGPLFP
jgi:RHS repeat-associated protein